MILTASRTESVREALLARLLPRFVKRVVFLATLFCSIEAVRGILVPRLQQMNEELKLVHDTSILKHCNAFTDIVWKHGCPISLELSPLAETRKVVEQTPKWLRYDDEKVMCDDVVRLVMCRV